MLPPELTVIGTLLPTDAGLKSTHFSHWILHKYKGLVVALATVAIDKLLI